jgi:hypothetical protein
MELQVWHRSYSYEKRTCWYFVSTVSYNLLNIHSASFAKCKIPKAAHKTLQKDKYITFTVASDTENLKGKQYCFGLTVIDITLCVSREPKNYYAASCCIYRNDDNIVKQWLEWNTHMGLEHFILYDHKSTDTTNKVRVTLPCFNLFCNTIFHLIML